MYSFVTILLYLIPVGVSLWREPFSCRAVFFVYTLMGAWLYGLFLEMDLLTEDHILASWRITFEDIPWLGFAFVNFLVFVGAHSFEGVHRKKARNDILQNRFFDRANYLIVFSLLVLAFELLFTLLVYGGVSNFIFASYSRVAIEDSRVNMIFPLLLLCNALVAFVYAVFRYGALANYLKVLGAFFITTQLIYTLLAGGRSIFLLLMLGLVVIHFRNFRNIGLIKIIVFSLAIILLSGLMIYQRFETQSGSSSIKVNASSLLEASYTGLPMIDHLALSREYAEIVGHSYGIIYLNAPLLFIPRSIWPGKPIQVSRDMRDVFWGDDSGGIPPGLFGEGYISFGWFGVVFMGLIFARLILFVDIFITRAKIPVLSLVRRAIFPPVIGFILVRGGVDIGIYRVGIVVIMYFIVEWFLIKKMTLGREC